MSMDIHQLRVFASVFRNRSFSRAAEELHLTQPTVSEHIMALEAELKCRLFDRLPRKIIPTKEAELLKDLAIEIIEKMEGIAHLLGQFNNKMSGHLVIGASNIPGTYILPGLTASFRKLYPSVLFEIPVSDSRGIINRIMQHELLIGIVGARLGSGLEYTSFMEDELVAVASRSFPVPATITIKDLIRFPMIMREEGSGTKKEFEKILDGKGVSADKLNIAAVFGSTDAVKQAVKEGMGITILSRRAVLDELDCKKLKELKIKDTRMKRDFFIVTHKKRTLPHLYKAFFEFLIEHQASFQD